MTPNLYGHPFSSYTQKALIAFYEKDAPFVFREIGPDDPATAAEWMGLWPIGKFPVVECDGLTVVEASAIIEWLEAHAPGAPALIPADPADALQVRMRDRIFDNYVMGPMQTIVLDRIRPQGAQDAYGVQKARETLDRIYAWLDAELAAREWASGADFSMADCAAAPSLFYADWAHPFDGRPNLIAYYERLRARPSVMRCVEDARAFRHFFPSGAPKDRVG